MTRVDFLNSLTLWELGRLQTVGVHVPGGVTRFGFMLVKDQGRDFADLMFEGKMLGNVAWRNSEVEFDPPLGGPRRQIARSADLDEWASRAYDRLKAGILLIVREQIVNGLSLGVMLGT